MLVSPSVHPLVGGDSQSRDLREVKEVRGSAVNNVFIAFLKVAYHKKVKKNNNPDLVELTHDEHRHPHEVEDAVEEHPEHPGGAGGDLGQIEPEAVLGVTGGAVDPPV